MAKATIWGGLVGVALYLSGGSAVAGWPYLMLGGEAGQCISGDSSYDDTNCGSAFLGTRFSRFDLQLSGSLLGKYRLKEQTSTNIEVKAISFLAVPHIPIFSKWTIDLFGGTTYYKAEAKLAGFGFGEEEDFTPTLGLGVAWNIKRYLELRMRWQYYDDISGEHINSISIGTNFTIAGRAKRR